MVERLARVPRRPPQRHAQLPGDEAGGDVAGTAGDRAARMPGRARAIEIRDRRLVAEVIVHHLIGVEGAHEDVALAHIDHLLRVFAPGVDVARQHVLVGHIRADLGPGLDDLVGELFLETLVILPADVGIERHHMPGIGRRLAGRRLRRVEQAERSRAELDHLRHAAGLGVLVRREQVVHGLRADAPFLGTVDVRIEFFRGKARAFIERQMQSEQAPLRVLELVDLVEERLRQLRAADELLEGLMHVEGRGDELGRADGAAVGQRDAGRLAAFDDDAVDSDLWLKRAAGGDETFHQSARQIERAALAELIAALQVEGADHRTHRAGFRCGVDQPGSEQRDLEQEQELDVLVLEQIAHHFQRFAARNGEEFAAECRLRQQRLTLRLRQRFGKPLRHENLAGDGLGARIPVAECLGVSLGKTGEIGDGFLEIAAEHQRRAVGMGLRQFVARRDVVHALADAEILEPRRLGDVEMIDRMQVVIEAWQRHFLGGEAAAVAQPTFHQQNLQAGASEIGAEDQAMMSGADDDPVISPVECGGHGVSSGRCPWICRGSMAAHPRRSMVAPAGQPCGRRAQFFTHM